MTIPSLYKLLKSEIAGDREIAKELLFNNPKLLKDFLKFHSCVGDYPFKKETIFKEAFSYRINDLWHLDIEDIIPDQLLMEIMQEIWNKTDKDYAK